MTSTIRSQNLRSRRAIGGEKRFEVWLSPERQADLKLLQKDGRLAATDSISAAIFVAASLMRGSEDV